MTASADELRPNLQLVPAQRIRFHEALEHRRTHRLVERLKTEARLRNPPIVATMPDGDYLLLDGANRVSAFLELGYSHVPVQVVEYGDTAVQLKGWHHLLMDAESLRLRPIYEALARVTMRRIEQAQLVTLLELRQVFAVLVEHGNAFWGLFPNGQSRPTIEERIEILNEIVDAYEGQSKIERIKLADYSQLPKDIDEAKQQLVLFPVLYKEELIALAAQGIRIPTGLSRHLVPGRTLGLNLKLAFLTELETHEEKVAHFESYLRQLAVEGRIRFYEEPVFIMNE
ncbi:MAG: hypothetical protein GWN84_07180 [Gammaproteobacteria bacterium]|nr:hypothetical protein [Gammaproteobacteria bacterium]NIR82669.1 hypothetical protein [Gammaproteobacteria bacterium]NIR89376.1 hypothetical protein [Gammaproteobacteria bacterium]NIU03817.1 hypothetical protein [Gammaproteobacteria bacterium]NIV51151.1 hypothetical protein [Gammaproteobacteria bacterium]